jgi:hypothetical protein
MAYYSGMALTGCTVVLSASSTFPHIGGYDACKVAEGKGNTTFATDDGTNEWWFKATYSKEFIPYSITFADRNDAECVNN